MPGFYLALLVIVSAGVYIRLDQFTFQVLLDDEWHVIHQLLFKGPRDLFQTFGQSDFSIPLALLYWSELRLFGLSELGMRWPMMLAGISTLLVFPLYVRRYFDDRVTLVFSLLLAISPLLVLYSRTARPYALTLVLSLAAIAAIHKYVEAKKPLFIPGFVYVVCAVASVWLHLISLPMVIAPFLSLGIAALYDQNWNRIRRLLGLGLITLAGFLTVVLPPLLGHPEALSVKLGVQAPDLQTYIGVFFVWLGTPSSGLVLIGVLLAVTGFPTLWRAFPLTPSLLTGLCMTFLVILVSKPAWVHNPLTLGRYLLLAIPVLLLSISVGVSRSRDLVTRYWGSTGKYVSLTFILAVLLLVIHYSPLQKIMKQPNSNSLHSVYQFDFRDEHNLVALYQKDFPVSPFWQQLASFPPESLKIAVSPFSFETHHWDAARWEQISHQRVMPGYLTGFCIDRRWGEVPNDQAFKFRNIGYLSDQNDLIDRGFDLVVYQKPQTVLTNEGKKEFGMETAGCEIKLREQFSMLIYEDELLLVFSLTEALRGQFDVTR